MSKQEKRKNKKNKKFQTAGENEDVTKPPTKKEGSNEKETTDEKEESAKFITAAEDEGEEEDNEESKIKKELEESERDKEDSVGKEEISVKEEEEKVSEEKDVSKEQNKGEEDKKEVKLGLSISGKSVLFDKDSQNEKKKAFKGGFADGNEEDDEDGDGGYSEEEEDWEWDYGEEWEEGDEEKDKDKNEDDQDTGGGGAGDSDYLDVDSGKEKSKSKSPVKKVSLNPLPPERLERGSSEKSSDRTGHENESANENDDSDSETGASSNGDIEDNLDACDTSKSGVPKNVKIRVSSTCDEAALLEHLEQLEPFHPDPEHLDPHMEQLCRKVRKLSVAATDVQMVGDLRNEDGAKKEYVIEENVVSNRQTPSLDDRRQRLRLETDWVARSLTSIAPRYHSQSGECSVYSCLTQFTAPELLTGQNKWACEKCNQIQAARANQNSDSELESSSSSNEKKKPKSKTVYSNASKQLLIFCPPAVLTIQLKRFQQSMYNLRKVNRHVEFPLVLNLAPFCSSTSISTSTVNAGVKDILYHLYAIVEHSGRLQGGHYTAYVKVRPADSKADYTKFYSAPTAKTEEIHSLLGEIERKYRELADKIKAEEKKEEKKEEEKVSEEAPPKCKWYYISDSCVTEVSEEKALKCQAYLLFYERTA